MKTDTETKAIPPPALCPTGIAGLDDVLAGGLPADCFYLVQGDPGAGKTTLALQFLREGVRRGERVFYITLSETTAELEKVARSHGWTLAGIPLLELSAIESLLRPDSQTTVFHPSEVELNAVTRLLLDDARRHQPIRVVFDSLSEYRLMAESPLRYRRQLLSLKQEFAKFHSTVLVLDDKMENSAIGSDPHILSLTHGVIELEQLAPDYGRSRRRLRVLKMRGVAFREGYHDYLIEAGGLRVFPRLVAAEHHTVFRREPVASGNAELDALLGGGLDRGTTTLILGPAGTGKSTLALQYAAQLAGRGERSAVFAFDEIRDIILTRAAGLGLAIAPHVESGAITIQQLDPAEVSPGEFAGRVVTAVAAGCKLVVIDTLNGYLNAMPGEKYLYMQLHELAAYLNQQGVLTIFILAQHGLVASPETPVDLSYLADTVVSLRYFEAAGAVRQAISVIKKRSGPHERTIREFRLEPGRGIHIGTPLKEFRGVLTGIPEFHGSAGQTMEQPDAGQ
jgi:circadian clock protein KaiC